MRNAVLGLLLTIGWIVPGHGGGVYLYEVNATEVSLVGAGWATRAGELRHRLFSELLDD